jgi:glycosyltransferase involved in cell wall biosynthesis
VIISNTAWSIYNFRKSLIQQLQQQGHTVHCMAPEDAFSSRIVDELHCPFIPLQQLDAKGSNLFNDLRLVLEFFTHLRRLKPDVLLSFTAKPNIYGNLGAMFLKVRCINTVNGLGEGLAKNNWLSRIMRLLYTIAFRKSDRVIFQNPDDQDFFTGHRIIPPSLARMTNGSGIDLQEFSLSKKPQSPSDALVFLMSARLVAEKGIREYIGAATVIKVKFPRTRFLFSGIVSAQSDALAAELKACEAIEFLGACDNMNSLLETVDVLVLPSYYREGVPRVLLEGLSKGLPLITTNHVGCKETVEDGINGYLIEIRSTTALTDAFERMIALPADERSAMGMKSRQLAIRKFDVHGVNEVYIQCINEPHEFKHH